MILLFESETGSGIPWDVARATCATKFNGNPMADLVELDGLKKSFAVDLLKKLNTRIGIDWNLAR